MTKLNEMTNKDKLAWLDKLAAMEATSNLRGVRTWHSPIGEFDTVGLEAMLFYGVQRYGNDGVGSTKDLSDADKAKAIDGATDRLERAKRGEVGRVSGLDDWVIKVVKESLNEESAKAFAKIDAKDKDKQSEFLESLFNKAPEATQATIRETAEKWRADHIAAREAEKARKAALAKSTKITL